MQVTVIPLIFPNLNVPWSKIAVRNLINNQHEDEPEHQWNSNKMMSRVLMVFLPTMFITMVCIMTTVGHIERLHTFWDDNTESCSKKQPRSHYTNQLRKENIRIRDIR